MELPSLDAVIETLRQLAEVDSIDADARVADIGVDSLDLLEWCYTLEDEYGVEIQDAVLESIQPDDTVRVVYDKVMVVLRDVLDSKAAT